jgi:hypothetical protein
MSKFTKGVGFEKDLVRLPGQSVSESLLDYVQDKVDSDLLVISVSVALLIFVWIDQLFPVTNPVLVSIIMVATILVSAYRLRNATKRMQNLRQGRDGERYVGQLLEGMRKDGNIVFHDVIAENFNIDHVLIGPKGIYVIETKTWGKGSGKGSITYKDGVFKLNGQILDKNPLDQAKANTKWFSEFLKESTGKAFSVSPVVVLPGWFIEKDDTKRAERDGVLLLNPKVLSVFINNGKGELSNEDVHLTSFHTARYVKSK